MNPKVTQSTPPGFPPFHINLDPLIEQATRVVNQAGLPLNAQQVGWVTSQITEQVVDWFKPQPPNEEEEEVGMDHPPRRYPNPEDEEYQAEDEESDLELEDFVDQPIEVVLHLQIPAQIEMTRRNRTLVLFLNPSDKPLERPLKQILRMWLEGNIDENLLTLGAYPMTTEEHPEPEGMELEPSDITGLDFEYGENEDED